MIEVMTKDDMKLVVNELRNGVYYPDVDTSPLYGCACPDFPKNKIVRKEVIVQHLRWQCLFLDGNVDEQELSDTLWILKDKRVIMV